MREKRPLAAFIVAKVRTVPAKVGRRAEDVRMGSPGHEGQADAGETKEKRSRAVRERP